MKKNSQKIGSAVWYFKRSRRTESRIASGFLFLNPPFSLHPHDRTQILTRVRLRIVFEADRAGFGYLDRTSHRFCVRFCVFDFKRVSEVFFF